MIKIYIIHGLWNVTVSFSIPQSLSDSCRYTMWSLGIPNLFSIWDLLNTIGCCSSTSNSSIITSLYKMGSLICCSYCYSGLLTNSITWGTFGGRMNNLVRDTLYPHLFNVHYSWCFSPTYFIILNEPSIPSFYNPCCMIRIIKFIPFFIFLDNNEISISVLVSSFFSCGL